MLMRSLGIGFWILLAIATAHAGQPGAKKAKSALNPPTGAAGRVVNPEGKPVAGADVVLYYERHEDGLLNKVAGRTKTDAEGKFSLPRTMTWDPPLERSMYADHQKYDLIVRHPDYAIFFNVLKRRDPADKLVLKLGKPNKVAVRTVVDATSHPVQGAKVFLMQLMKPANSPARAKGSEYAFCRLAEDIGICSGITDAEGKVTLPNGGQYGVEKEGYVTTALRANEGMLFPGATVSGRVLDPQGKPVAGAPVVYKYESGNAQHKDAVLTDAQGRFEFKDTAAQGFRYSGSPAEQSEAGNSTLAADDPNKQKGNLIGQVEKFQVKPGEKVERDIKMKRGVVLAGTVVNATTGEPVPNFELMQVAEDGSGYLLQFTTNAQGRFRLVYPKGTPGRIYWSSSRSGNYIMDPEQSRQQAWEGPLSEDKTDLVLKARLWDTGPLQGTVLDVNGKPAEGHMVYVHSDVPGARTGPAGRFTIKAAPRDRDIDLLVLGPGKKTGALVHCKAGTTSVSLATAPLREYAGEVKTPDGMPATGLKFSMYLRMNDSTIYDSQVTTQTGDDGTFKTSPMIPTGNYMASWSSDNLENRDYDYGNATIDLAKLKAGEPIRFVAKMYVNTLIGKVVDEQDKPVGGAQLTVMDYSMVTQGDQRKPIKSETNGTFKIERLAGGKVMFQVMHAGHKNCVALADSDAVDCVVKLRPASAESIARFKVVDEAGAPLSSATLKFFMRSMPKPAPEKKKTPAATLRTDAQGVAEYRSISGLLGTLTGGGGDAVFCCDMPGYELAFGQVNPNEDSETLVKLFKGEGGFSGQVFGEDGKPFGGAEVIMTGWGAKGSRSMNNFDESLGIRAVTGQDGKFVFPRVHKDGSVGYRVVAQGFATLEGYYFEGNSTRGRLQLSRAGSISGVVMDRDTGKPASGGDLYAWGGNRSVNAKVGADGEFVLEGLYPGPWNINLNQLRMPGSNQMKIMERNGVSVTVEPGTQTPVMIWVITATPVKGKVIDANTGKAPKDRYIVYTRRTDDTMNGWATGMMVEPGRDWNVWLAAGTYEIGYYNETKPGEMTTADEKLTIEKGKKYENVVIKVK